MVERVLELIEFNNAGSGGNEGRTNIIHNKNLAEWVFNRAHEVRFNGGGLSRVLTTGPNSAPARPKAAPPSRHNNRHSCARTQNTATCLVPNWELNGGENPGCGIYRSAGRLVDEGGAVNVAR